MVLTCIRQTVYTCLGECMEIIVYYQVKAILKTKFLKFHTLSHFHRYRRSIKSNVSYVHYTGFIRNFWNFIIESKLNSQQIPCH